MRKCRFIFSTTSIIMISFLSAILIGSLLLVLPISVKNGVSVSYVDALFTATTATCVTGLVTVPTVATWSVFGQIVILFLIQLGGLGVVTVMSWLMLLMHKKFRIRDHQLLQDAFNLNTLSGLRKFVKKVIVGTLIIEGLGALLYMPVFIPDFGIKGIWISVFNSVSAFCNAGIDIIALDSLCSYATNPLINFVTCALIVLGGLGYVVWWDVLRVLKEFKTQKLNCFKHLTLHSKIALVATAALIFGGAAFVFAFEYNNPLTLAKYSLFDKIQISFFQSVTTRTAGFATLPQENLTNATSIVCILLMFIGGSPVGTAGGVKTVTAVVLFTTAFATIQNKEEPTIFNRTLSKQAIRKSIAVVCASFSIAFISTVLLAAVTPASALDVIYEAFSATATVGLTRNLTAALTLAGKWILIVTMYLGRIGPITLLIAFSTKKQNYNLIQDPVEELSVG